MSELSRLKDHARWLRREARLELIWITNLKRNQAPDELLAEHHTRKAKLERTAAAAEARIAELSEVA
jgi:hypothetical protein